MTERAATLRRSTRLANRSPGTAREHGVRDDHVTVDPPTTQHQPAVPRIPASAGALIFDDRGRLLVLKPSYKKHWTIPGGQIEPDGESPWETCRREAREECGLDVERGRLVCVDFLRPKGERLGGVRFLFDCGTFSDAQLASDHVAGGRDPRSPTR